MSSVVTLKRRLPPPLFNFLRYVTGPLRSNRRFQEFLAYREVGRLSISEIRAANQLLHIGNQHLLLCKHDDAIQYYLAACEKNEETRWISGRTLLDYISTDSFDGNDSVKLLLAVTADPKYIVPDLEKRLFKIALASDPAGVESLFATIPYNRLE